MKIQLKIFNLIFFVALSIYVAPPNAKAQSVPTTNVPAGFGRYCSVTYPGGGWALLNYADKNSDPCKELLKPGSNGKIERAGLWAVSKNNNVMRTCDGDLGIYREVGNAVIKLAFDQASGKKNCVFTIAPTALHVFSRPYLALPLQGNLVRTTNPHDFNFYDKPMKPADFGQTKNNDCPNSMFIDRSGRQRCAVNNHGGYDWLMPTGLQMLAVADGVVREARWRDVKAFGGDCAKKNPQGEIYVEHQIGTGEYAERFVTYYAHVSEISVKKGDRVTRGQVIGKSGDTGCSSAPHLHFGVARTTNLSGHRRFDLTYPNKDYGVSGISGWIDPFGWNAPKQIDPWAWAFLGNHPDQFLGTITNPGAFSIYLWREGQAPVGN
jgi:hypothetical protein